MNIVKSLGSTRTDKMAADSEGTIRELRDTVFRQAENIDGETTASNLGTLLERVSGTSTKEIDNLIGDLQALRKKLQADSNRIQRDIAEYASLSQSVMQLTKIVSDSVKKLPDAPEFGA
jgi:ABC-type transporter Mla subunit MlaD